jgi:hypothetical protein
MFIEWLLLFRYMTNRSFMVSAKKVKNWSPALFVCIWVITSLIITNSIVIKNFIIRLFGQLRDSTYLFYHSIFKWCIVLWTYTLDYMFRMIKFQIMYSLQDIRAKYRFFGIANLVELEGRFVFILQVKMLIWMLIGMTTCMRILLDLLITVFYIILKKENCYNILAIKFFQNPAC